MTTLLLSLAFLASQPEAFSVERGFTVKAAPAPPHFPKPAPKPAAEPKQDVEPIPPKPAAVNSRGEAVKFVEPAREVALDFKPAPKAEPADDRQWYPLSTHPGYYGFGRKNSAGQVVVEQHRFGESGEIRQGPAPAAPQAVGPPATCLPGQPCYNAQFGQPAFVRQRGFFGGVFGR